MKDFSLFYLIFYILLSSKNKLKQSFKVNCLHVLAMTSYGDW